MFYGAGGNAGASLRAWNKPPGVSHVYMMLIGGGGDGDGAEGGGSGAVTVWYGAAQHVPDSLILAISRGNNLNTTVFYRTPSGLTSILVADGASGITAGTAMSANQFTASGFFRSTTGQNGSSASVNASTTTFLSGGTNSTNVINANYGYRLETGNRDGFFMLQPIIVGIAANGTNTNGGIGCGGGHAGSTKGGTGMALIASW